MRNIPIEFQSTLQMNEHWAKRNRISRRLRPSRVQYNGQRVALSGCLKTLRKFWVLLCLLGMPFVAHAQSNKTSWENLSGLAPGHKIQVVEMNSKKVSGTFVSVSDTAILLQDPSGEQTVQRTDVRIVKLIENKHRLRNAAIGAGVGAGVMAGIGAGADHDCSSFCIGPGRGTVVGVFAAGGAAGGAIVGALWPSHETLYRAIGK